MRHREGTSELSSLTLPRPPLPDFEYPTSLPNFDFDLFPSSSGGTNPFGFVNPFSPPAFSPPFSPTTAPTPPHHQANSVHSTHSPFQRDPSAPLFDDSESALFSSFLNTFAVDQNFLFNPVLPPGMPSPPPSHLMMDDERHERDTLGAGLGSMQLGMQDDRQQRWVKEEEVDDGFQWREGKNSREMEAGGSGRGKKVRTEWGGEDYEMDGGEDDAATTTNFGSAGRRRPPPARSTTSTARPRRVSAAVKGRYSSPPPVPDSVSPEEQVSDEEEESPDAADRRAPLTESQKRSNHILSEQKRRNAIRSGFKDLVDLLTAGEAASGIVVAPPEPEYEEGKKKKTKGSGRGRGRRGESGAGASKSIVLEKASSYMLWLERGNDALEDEVARVERILGI
jgi:hypothetical protein